MKQKSESSKKSRNLLTSIKAEKKRKKYNESLLLEMKHEVLL